MTTWKEFQGQDYGIATFAKINCSPFGFMSHFLNPKDEEMYEHFQNWCIENNINQEDNLIKFLKDSKSSDENFNNYINDNKITKDLAQEFLFAIGRKEEESLFGSFDWSKTGIPVDDSTAKFASECKLPEQVMKPPSISENDNEKGFDPKQIHSTSPLQDILKKIENACREKEYYCEEYTDQSMLIILDSNDCGIKLNFYKDVDQYVIRGSCIQKNIFSFPNTFNENIFNELKAIVNAI